jgi:two-component system, cell cycle sensor histidine kinase PleC
MRAATIFLGVGLLCLLGLLPALHDNVPGLGWLPTSSALVVGALFFVACFTGMMVVHLSRAHEEAARAAEDLAQANSELERMVGERTQSLSEKVAELEQARSEAVDANAAKSRFLAAMSHELRTPLNSILGFSEIIRREMYGTAGNARYPQYAGLIHESGSHLLSLIGDILDLSKIEAGKKELHCVPLEVREVVAETLRLAGAQGVGVGVEDGLPMLDADRRAVTQMLVNLLSNARKFTPEGGTISLRATLRDDGGVTLAVRDSGIGIAKENIPRVLADYGQVENEQVRSQAGTGLGLPIVGALMSLHGGALELESEVGRGTCVSLNFPPSRTLGCRKIAGAA